MSDHKPTVLVVDDEQIICDLLKTVLAHAGYDVFTASSGREGVALFQKRRPQFTLLDLRMPEMNGIEVLRDIRKLDPQADVMVLTAWGSDALEREARKLGVTDFLSKRMTLDVIMTSMERIIQKPRPASSAETAAAAKAPAAATPAAAPVADGVSILVVDDDQQICDTLSKALAKLGHRVRTTVNGVEAVIMATQEVPALLILDMNMPDMNGIGVLRQLHEKKITSGIILLTDTQDEKTMTEALDLGVVDIIGKPVDIDRLMLAVQLGLMLKNR